MSFFDLGVRRLAAREGAHLIPSRMGALFEQWVGLEILRHIHAFRPEARLKFWRDPDGPEVDWVYEIGKSLVPIEVKWTSTPKLADVKHLETFLNEYPEAKRGFVICRSPRRMRISPKIEALPWQELERALEF